MNVPFFDISNQYKAIKDEVESAVLEVLGSCSYIGGKYVSEFEKSVKEYLGVEYVSGCSNGTDALVLGLKACGVNPGDEVITTPFTFFATAEAISSVGAVPVFVDVKSDDYTIDPEKIEDAISSKTKAILPVHIFGTSCDMDRIMEIARRNNLKVIEDAAQAIGCEYKGKKAGTIGDVGCFSFYPTKNLGGVGDGGMVVTNAPDIYVLLKAFKEHGAGENGAKAYELLGGAPDSVDVKEKASELYNPYKYYNYLIGYNSRLDALQAVVLNIKLKHLDEYLSNRDRVAKMYLKNLTSKLVMPLYGEDVKPCWHQFVVRSDRKMQLCSYLSENGVGNGTFYPVPLHRQKAFEFGNCRISGAPLVNADRLSQETVCLPIFPEITDEQVEYVIETVNRFYE